MNNSAVVTKMSPRNALWLVRVVYALPALLIIARFVCLLAVLQPENWLSAASIARWVWLAVILIPTLLILLLHLAGRFLRKSNAPSLLSRGFLSGILSLITVVALARGNLSVALVLSYFWDSIGSLQKRAAAHTQSQGNLRRIQQINRGFVMLYFPLLVGALALRSLPIAVIILGAEVVSAVIQIPLIKRLEHQFVKNATQK